MCPSTRPPGSGLANAQAISSHLCLAQVVAAVTRGLQAGCRAHPLTRVGQILCFIDNKPEWAEALVDLASELCRPDTPFDRLSAECPVLAVDIAAGERHFVEAALQPPGPNGSTHQAAICRCAKRGLGITNHAGESGPASHVVAATGDAYGRARRIGHGYAVVKEAREAAGRASGVVEVVEAMRELGVVDGLCFECCPTSSRSTSGWDGEDWKEHPIAFLMRLRAAAREAGDAASEAALPLPTLSSDDPVVFGSSLTDEFALAVTHMGLAEPELKQLVENAAASSFLHPEAKKALTMQLDKAWKEWERAR